MVKSHRASGTEIVVRNGTDISEIRILWTATTVYRRTPNVTASIALFQERESQQSECQTINRQWIGHQGSWWCDLCLLVPPVTKTGGGKYPTDVSNVSYSQSSFLGWYVLDLNFKKNSSKLSKINTDQWKTDTIFFKYEMKAFLICGHYWLIWVWKNLILKKGVSGKMSTLTQKKAS